MPSLPVAVTVKRGLVRAAAGRQTRTVHDWSDRFTSKRDELAAHFNRSLGEDADGKPIRVDRKRKTVSTSVGDLPISPIMDPDFKEARRRYNQPKPKPQKTTAPNSGVKERLRKKLLQNPYAHALATSMRYCHVTETPLPSYFLQKLKAVTHPETTKVWVVPEDLTAPVMPGEDGRNEEGQPDTPSENETPDPTTPKKPSTSSPTSYILSRKSLLKNIGALKGDVPFSESVASLYASRSRLLTAFGGLPVWRSDMDDVVLENMRRHIVKAFLYYIKLNEKDSRDYLRPCPSWDGVRKMKHRGCLLWLPQPEGESLEHRTGLSALEQFATFDVPYAKWQKSLPIYDLERLLGPDHLATLRELPLFRENSLLMLGKRRSIPTQLYLWKIQGYLATFPELDEFDAISKRFFDRTEKNAKSAKVSTPHQR